MIKTSLIRRNNFFPFFILMAIVLLLTNRVYAQNNPADSLLQQATLPNIIQYALKRQPLLQQSLIDERNTDLQIKSKLADWYPQINFNYLYQHNFQVQVAIIGGNTVRLGVNNTSAIQFAATQTIFNRDVLLANRTKGDVQQQARQQTENNRINVMVNVSRAFYDLLATEQQIKVTDENIARIEQSLKDSRARYDAGISDKTDYKRATIALNNAKAAKRNNEEALKAKTEYLKALMNYPVGQLLKIMYDSTELEREILLDTLQPVDFTRRVEYRLLQTQLRLQQANVKYNKWSFIPSLSANGAYNLNFLNNNFSKLYNQSFPNSFAGLTVAFPIFQGGQRKYDIQLAQWQLKRTELDLVNLENSVNTEYSSALANYKASLSNYLAVKENVLLAKDVYEVINLQYNAGIKTYIEVVNAETDLRTAQINYFNALYQVLSSKIDVKKSLGEIKL